MTNRLRSLCAKHTNLSNDDITEIEKQINQISDKNLYPESDVFIDIIDCYSGEAIVVFQRMPICEKSLYSKDIVGDIAKRKNEPAVYRTMETSLNSLDLMGKSQEGQSMRQRVYPIRNNKKNIAVLIVENKLDDSNNADTKIDENIYEISADDDFIINKIDSAVLSFNDKGKLYRVNHSGEKLYARFGYQDNLINLHYDNLSLDFSTFEQIMYFKTVAENTSSMERKVFFNNSYFDVKYIFAESHLGFTMIIKDITEIKMKEEEIVHKTVAIREIHHRVKNNLQTIISLLRIQSRRTEIEDAKQILDESVNRVQAIARTHELLSRQLEDNIKLEEVLISVMSNLQRGSDENRKITVERDINSDIYLSSDKTVDVALVINELVQNSYKHAFEGKEVGTIKVSADYDQGQRFIKISVEDDGVGYDINDEEAINLGLQIIKSYAEDKLRGILKIQSDSNGTKTTIKFKP